MSRFSVDDHLWVLSYTLQELAQQTFEDARREHPLLQRVSQITGTARRLEISADVRTKYPAVASYDVPRVGLTSRFRLPDSLEDDALRRWAVRLVDHVTGVYRRDVLRRLYRSSGGLLGLDGLAPPVVGNNVVGGLSELTMPGWRSRAIRTQPRTDKVVRPAYQALVRLSCGMPRNGNGDLVLVGDNVFREIFGDATLFFVNSADPRLIRFNRGFLYRDPYCQPDEAFAVSSQDLRFYSSPPTIQMMQVPGAPLAAIAIGSAEQLIAQRRYGLGRMVAAAGAESQLS
jgi:hypothetical protein